MPPQDSNIIAFFRKWDEKLGNWPVSPESLTIYKLFLQMRKEYLEILKVRMHTKGNANAFLHPGLIRPRSNAKRRQRHTVLLHLLKPREIVLAKALFSMALQQSPHMKQRTFYRDLTELNHTGVILMEKKRGKWYVERM